MNGDHDTPKDIPDAPVNSPDQRVRAWLDALLNRGERASSSNASSSNASPADEQAHPAARAG